MSGVAVVEPSSHVMVIFAQSASAVQAAPALPHAEPVGGGGGGVPGGVDGGVDSGGGVVLLSTHFELSLHDEVSRHESWLSVTLPQIESHADAGPLHFCATAAHREAQFDAGAPLCAPDEELVLPFELELDEHATARDTKRKARREWRFVIV